MAMAAERVLSFIVVSSKRLAYQGLHDQFPEFVGEAL
jgi:hypothetical protein